MKESDIGTLLRAQQLILSSDKDITTVGLDLVYRLLSSTAPSWLQLNGSQVQKNSKVSIHGCFRSYGTLITISDITEPLLIVCGVSTYYRPHGSSSDTHVSGLVCGGEVQARSYINCWRESGITSKIVRLAEESYKQSPAQVERETERCSAVETEKAILRYLGNK